MGSCNPGPLEWGDEFTALGLLAILVLRQKDGPKDIHTPVPGTSKFVVLHGKRDYADVIKVQTLDREICLYYLSGPNLIT